ncbi:serine hydrolase domain-containing protein [Shewanella sp. YLB-07]|uniref:serine hydrolase domain-containing protein n=1 Tax=Shewanella sp. YLB-07 TaxID=2601268 RepID=UPI00128B3C7A|nr:serine hydrolase [Shewanella sp. YLB-07]MPY24965.1 serine hydrolase [Shewanella sp. YLB-07]
MKKSVIALSVLFVAFGASANVTYHEPNAQYEANLNEFGAGVKNWEEARLVPLTLADSHLYHYHAVISAPTEKMPMKLVGGLDVSKIMIDDLIPNRKISLYDVMRDRASMQNYVVMNKKGEILAEDYWNGTDKNTKNHLMSAHKSFTSMALFIAQEEGFLKLSDPAGKYVTEFKGTKFENIPLQNFADMTTGIIDLPANRPDYHWGSYGAGTTGSWDSSMPSVVGYSGLVRNDDGDLVPPADALGNLETFSDYLTEFVKHVEPKYPAGEVYEYKDINTEILGVAITRSSGLTLSEFFDKYLWSKGGFNSEATMYVNQAKESAASGSLNVTVRDFAIGSFLMVNDGKNWKGEQVLPKAYVDAVKNGDDGVKQAWPKVSYEHMLFENAFYKDQWRTATHPVTGRKISMMVGVNGQFSAFDHVTGNIVAISGAYREPSGLGMMKLYLLDTIFTIFDTLAVQQAK